MLSTKILMGISVVTPEVVAALDKTSAIIRNAVHIVNALDEFKQLLHPATDLMVKVQV